MRALITRIVPVATLVTAGLLIAVPAGAASAAPQQSTSAVSAEQLAPTGKHGPYPSKQSCQSAGKKGQSQGHWHHYSCKQENHKWYLYTS
ncbi:hypothetical protein ACM614_02215 [Streptomyces sp. 12297]|uniref:hypothetical protein n=1 Tax=Streptomyces sp. NBC_00239 TaxID=2903640 RepID=UPI002E2DC574|nr:hypothetical protein [Streptomyces sp. NBC_00239]